MLKTHWLVAFLRMLSGVWNNRCLLVVAVFGFSVLVSIGEVH